MLFMDTSKNKSFWDVKYLFFVWVVNFAGWSLCQKSIEFIFSHSSARLAYGMICGWWGALYLGLLLRAYSWLALLVSFFITWVLLNVSILLKVPLLPIHDRPVQILYVFLYSGFFSIVISSPIILNTTLSYLSFFRKWHHCRQQPE